MRVSKLVSMPLTSFSCAGSLPTESAGEAFCNARTSFVTAVTVASTALSGLPSGTAMVLTEPAEVVLSVVDELECWPDPAWQAAASGSTAKTMSRVFRRGMGFSGRLSAKNQRKRCDPPFPRILHAGKGNSTKLRIQKAVYG